MLTKLKHFVGDESGATAIEYGLIATLIAIAVITAVSTLGNNLSSQFNKIADKLVKSPS
ncbi:Flp family type IVb pilin [Methylobacterium variabile]|jgi:pilus assembly protein Flp/PilA|uniref:Flp family type IVb pilin n=1 Tax=Methylobacterium variabile TaxID=298794 RepID=UPI0007C7AC0A|nr:Flp family type IVb pilin [Methylobacterium variabile]